MYKRNGKEDWSYHCSHHSLDPNLLLCLHHTGYVLLACVFALYDYFQVADLGQADLYAVKINKTRCLTDEVDYICINNYKEENKTFFQVVVSGEHRVWDLQDYSGQGSSIQLSSNGSFSSYTQLDFLNSSVYKILLKFETTIDFLVVCDRDYTHYSYDYNHSKS